VRVDNFGDLFLTGMGISPLLERCWKQWHRLTQALPGPPSSCVGEKSISFTICYLIVLIKSSTAFFFFLFYFVAEVPGEERRHKECKDGKIQKFCPTWIFEAGSYFCKENACRMVS